MSSAIEIRNMVKRYGAFLAVDAIDVDIADGEFMVLLGPSGCGKTTTLRCIAGLEDISEGEIRIGGEIISSSGFSVPPEKRDMGMVFQSYAIWPHMTVAENVAFGLKMQKLPRAEIESRVRRALDMVGLSQQEQRGASQLSGGQQQRVALARAIVLEPRVLLFDEPLSNLDAKLREHMRFELRQLQKRVGITSIYVTHDQQEAMIIADRVILMNQGRIDQTGSPIDIYKQPVSRFGAEFIGLANFAPAEVIGDGAATLVRLASGQQLQGPKSKFRVGNRIEVVCRPEDVCLTDTRPVGDNTFAVRVVASYFLGNIGDVIVEAAGLQLRCQLSPPRPLQEGQELWARIAPEAIILIAS